MESDNRDLELSPDTERIKTAIKNDIQRANNFFNSKIEPVLRTRHQIYEADKKYYDQRFSKLGKQTDFISFDFWALV